MDNEETYLLKGKCIITISLALILMSIGLFITKNIIIDNQYYDLTFKQVNTQNISKVAVAFKKSSNTDIVKQQKLTEEPLTDKSISDDASNQSVPKDSEGPTLRKVKQPVLEKPKQQWFLPTVQGTITSYPRPGHNALDITSARGQYETIYPVAEGTVASIYYDYAGALIVIVNHTIDGKNYLSQYAHLSSLAPGLYAGKSLSVYDPIGQMGSTGISTGVHLHLAVVECSLYDATCPSLGHFFDFAKQQYNAGFRGLQNLMNVPYSWNGR